jgi:hypothetical protein
VKPYVPLVLLTLTHSSILAASDKAKQDGKDLVEKAEAKANIFELPSFKMKANVRLVNKGHSLDGPYVLLWNGPEQWREEINLPDYIEVHVGGKGVVFSKRSTDFMPALIQQLHSALDYSRRITPGPNETVRKIQDRNVALRQSAR